MSNSQKVPFSLSMQTFVQDATSDTLQGLGQVLPCTITEVNGAIVTVSFEIDTNNVFTPPQVTCSTIGSKYIRVPLKPGDQGICVAANARLGGINGLGLGLAPIINPSNLGGLVFLPIGNINWKAVDTDAVVITAPNGASLQNDSGNSSIIVSNSSVTLTYNGGTIVLNNGEVKLSFSGNNIVIDSSGITLTGIINIMGALSINGSSYSSHAHSGVQAGSSNTGGVV